MLYNRKPTVWLGGLDAKHVRIHVAWPMPPPGATLMHATITQNTVYIHLRALWDPHYPQHYDTHHGRLGGRAAHHWLVRAAAGSSAAGGHAASTLPPP